MCTVKGVLRDWSCQSKDICGRSCRCYELESDDFVVHEYCRSISLTGGQCQEFLGIAQRVPSSGRQIWSSDMFPISPLLFLIVPRHLPQKTILKSRSLHIDYYHKVREVSDTLPLLFDFRLLRYGRLRLSIWIWQLQKALAMRPWGGRCFRMSALPSSIQ